MLTTAVRMMPWWQAVGEIDAMVKAADPELAREQRLLAAERRYVTVEPFEDGHSRFFGTLLARDALDFENVVDEIARTLPEPELSVGASADPAAVARVRRDIKRSLAVGELARGAFGQDALPVHELVVHIRAEDPALDPEEGRTGAATVEDWGNLLTEDLPSFLAGSKVVVRPVVDVRRLPTENAHDPTRRLRFAVQQRNKVDVFPYGTRASTSCDLDHTQPYTDDGPPGQTSLANLGPLSRRVHRAKTFGRFRLTQVEPGVFHWTTPHGWEFLVTPDGTTRIAETPPRRVLSGHEPPPDPFDDPPPPSPDEPPPPESVAWPIVQHQLFALST